ncbi:MAG: sugar nucleotide-binding protein, partial [Pseudomonadota bacterium]|nr:sugar nucleotide-binding protein [Pseudomonadota bacterium]
AAQPYTESDTPNPRSVYGRTKLAGEQAVLTACPDAVILRTAWVFSRDGRNFVNTMLRLAGEHDRLTVVADQFGSPTLADDLARATVEIIDRIAGGKVAGTGGLYHATGGGETSWHGFAEKIMALAGKTNVEVAPIATADYPTPAPRPARSVLSNRKLKQVFGIELPPWEDALRRCLQG